ncbi:MAG: hypothetical protein ACKV2U_14795, partial [Bryobacteraceae bacterium]
ALRGQPVVIYCTGLGAVNATVALGAAAPSDPLANVRGEVSVLVGGKEARVLFAGLSPGYAGLYQVNAVLAADTPTGDEISLVITAGGQQSNTVTVAVR